jgi:hypothetical protein
MYGYISINKGDCSKHFCIKTNRYTEIYDALRLCGYDHWEAEEIASWAPLAPFDSEFDNEHGDKIVILEGDENDG